MLGWNESHVECFGLVLEILETTRGGCWSDGEGFGFIIGLAADDERPDDPRQFVRADHDAFGLAPTPFGWARSVDASGSGTV